MSYIYYKTVTSMYFHVQDGLHNSIVKCHWHGCIAKRV